jgi:hypothetical protein
MNRIAVCTLAALSFLVGCSSSSSVAPPPTAAFTPLPVLVPGSKLAYAGRFSERVTYASPSPTQPNSLGTYTVSEKEQISNASSSAPAPIEVVRTLRYAVTHVPTSGVELNRRTIQAYDTSTVTASSQTITQAETTSTTTGIDATANRVKGNGPYQYKDAVSTQYAQPRTLLVFPLVVGSTAVPLARTVGTVLNSQNAQGDVYATRDTTTTYTNAGAYGETGSVGVGETTKTRAYADGKGSLVNTGTTALQLTIGLPVPGSDSGYVIPVIRILQGTKTSYQAEDWYPGGEAPPSPLASQTQTVKGSATIPPDCGVKVSVSNVSEVDTSSHTLNVIGGSYSEAQSREFLSNGIAACRISSTTTYSYDVTTGLLVSTTSDHFFEGLTSQSIPGER